MIDAKSDAYAVLLPAIADLELTPQLARFLDEGGKAFLIGETREEYLARRMSKTRLAGESAEDVLRLTMEIRRRAGAVLTAVDQEPGGICRLHALVPQFPDAPHLREMTAEEIERIAMAMALTARDLGLRMLLAPVLDVVTGANPWLAGREMARDATEVARIGAAFIRGVEAANVVATAKHFPGHAEMDGDPAIDIASVRSGAASINAGMAPFRAAVAAGCRAIMTGPALVPAVDPARPSSLSRPTIERLRRGLGFTGLIVSDDLDALGTLRDERNVGQAAVTALAAGSDLLLLSAENDLEELRRTILAAVSDGKLPAEHLTQAASRVRALAEAVG